MARWNSRTTPRRAPDTTDRRRDARRIARDAARGAALAVLVWTAVSTLGLLDLVNLAPDGGLVLIALIGATIGALGAELVLRVAAGLAALALVLVTSLPLAAALAPSTVRRDRPSADSGATVDAVAVLSGGVTDDGLLTAQGLDRLLDALALAHRTNRPLVVSVVRAARPPHASSRADQQRLAALAGVADRLWFVDSVRSTHDEALRMAALARARGWRRVALVTSPAHTRRACATFEHAGVAVVCTPAQPRDAAWDGPTPLRSAGDRLRATADWLYEEIGWAVYRARGWS